MRRAVLHLAKSLRQKEKAGGGEMAAVLQIAFQDDFTGYGNVAQRTNLLLKRRTYFTATISF
jgi:hypothetical protein